MKCKTHRTTMAVLNSRVSADERLIITTHYCSACGRRVVDTAPNPRFVPIIAPEKRPENKGARLQRHKPVMDPGYVPSPSCIKCGEVMRGVTTDGLCNICAALEATAA